MKIRVSSLMLLVVMAVFLCCQTALAQKDNVMGNGPMPSVNDFVPGQILVKFKDAAPTRLGKTGASASLGIRSVDALLQKYKIVSAEKLFPSAQLPTQRRMMKAYNGTTIEQPSLHNIYRLELSDAGNMGEAIEALKADENVEYAEPNYILSIVNAEPLSPSMSQEEMQQRLQRQSQTQTDLSKTSVVTPNDPLYSQQYYISAIHADAVWDSTKGDTTQVIAILDTGVDWLHPDLKNKIWINQAEANGIPGVDDDHNGLVDDIRGWDYINNDNNPMDDNSHGTHVAGIAAAEANNGIGIAGINWMAKIMPVKVFQSSGRGDAATIAQGITYAAGKGATVINMSFGSYARSLTMEAALSNAYATSVLVAAAGNDGLRIYPPPPQAKPFFPAALSYVLGVQAGDAMGPDGFSNYDDDGPAFSGHPDLLNYELKAPGVGILSTVPNGGYRVYNGTSMAAPVVSGAVALYLSNYPGRSQEMMWGDLINTSNQFIDIFAALHSDMKPVLQFLSSTIVDTLAGDNANSLVDAGETIQLWITARNTWGQSDSVWAKIQFREFEDTTTAQIIQKDAFIGSISAYAKRTNESHPFIIKIDPRTVHDRDISFVISLWAENSADTIRQLVTVNVENGTLLSGIIADTLKLTPDKFWLVSGSLKIAPTGVLLIKPGTHLEFKKNFVNDGKVLALGTSDSMITIKGICISGGNYRGTLELHHVNLSLSNYTDGYTYNITNQTVTIKNSVLQFQARYFGFWYADGEISESILRNWDITFNPFYIASMKISASNISDFQAPILYMSGISFQNCNFTHIPNLSNLMPSMDPVEFIGSNNIISLRNHQVFYTPGGYYKSCTNQYWGTSDSVKIENMIYDFEEDAALSRIVFSPFLRQPSDSCHGIVWKVLVDGKDVQDEAIDPLGVGIHRFDVYFNRPMDLRYPPQTTFGVREPFTQQSVSDSGRWSDNGRQYTAYKSIKLYTGDGINRICVTGARDLENFEIPIEDQRFAFVISAAGSASTDFMATPGLGKVGLEWSRPPEVSDLLGFNVYRFEHVTDTTFNDPVMINASLVHDTLYTDYAVTPKKKYYYYYKVVRTDFTESDSSKIISSTPYTASAGDANGDLAVNVLDIVSTVGYILGQSPAPFIFAAADINGDQSINVLDVVGTINLILHPSGKMSAAKTAGSIARLDMAGGRLTLLADAQVSALQFTLKGQGMQQVEFTPDPSLAQFEISTNTLGDTAKIILIYNLKGVTLGEGTHTLGAFTNLPTQASIADGVVSDQSGKNILTNIVTNGVALIPDTYSLEQNFPNPFNMTTRIRFGVPERTRAKIVIYNVLGQRVRTYDLGEKPAGRFEVTWDGLNEAHRVVSTGVYFYRFESDKFTQVKKLILLK